MRFSRLPFSVALLSLHRFTQSHTHTSDKGSFPLDHDAECKPFMSTFLKCLKKNDNTHGKCKHLSKAYLQCRMERNLMKVEPFEELGFVEGEEEVKMIPKEEKTDAAEKKRSEGYIAGLNVKGKAFRQLGEMARPPRPK